MEVPKSFGTAGKRISFSSHLPSCFRRANMAVCPSQTILAQERWRLSSRFVNDGNQGWAKLFSSPVIPATAGHEQKMREIDFMLRLFPASSALPRYVPLTLFD